MSNGLARYDAKCNLPFCEIIIGQFLVTDGSPDTAVVTTGYDKDFTVSVVAAGVYRVTLNRSQRYPMRPIVFANIAVTTGTAENVLNVTDGYDVTSGTVAGSSFDLQLALGATGTLVSPANPVRVNFMAVFVNKGNY